MKRKAQVSLFILLGVVLIIIVAGSLFFLSTSSSSTEKNFVFNEKSVNDYVTTCLKLTATDGLILLGKQGGHITLPQNHFQSLPTSYLRLNNQNLVPSTQDAAAELESYIDTNIDSCLQDFDSFKKEGISATTSTPKTKATLTQNSIAFELSYDILLKKGSKEVKIKQFAHEERINLAPLLSDINTLVDQSLAYNNLIDVDILKQSPLQFHFFPKENTLITVAEDPSYLVKGEPYKFIFALG